MAAKPPAAGLPIEVRDSFVAEIDLSAETDEEEEEAGTWDPLSLPDITTLASPFTEVLDSAYMALSPRALAMALGPHALSPTTPREVLLWLEETTSRGVPPSPSAPPATPRSMQHLPPPAAARGGAPAWGGGV